MGYNSTRWGLSQEEKEQQAARDIGTGYMLGTHSISDVIAYLNSSHWPMTYSEVREEIRHGVTTAIQFEDREIEPESAVLESRKQPEQDAQELATIYARKIKKVNWDNKPLHTKIVLAQLTKEQLNDIKYRSSKLDGVILEFKGKE